MTKKMTLEDIARELGYTKTTISRAISGKGRIGNETRQKILKYCDECGYKPNVIAKSLAESKAFNIGVVIPDDQELEEIPFFQSCLLGICDMASKMCYDVVTTTIKLNDITHIKKMVEYHKVDGLIITRPIMNDKAVEYLKLTNMPFVIVGTLKDKAIIQIDNNHTEACRELTSLLIAQGYKKLALIGGDMEHMVNLRRYNGFLEACEMHFITPNSDNIFLNCNNKNLVEEAALQIRNRDVDCIVSMDDKICGQLMIKLINEKMPINGGKLKLAAFYTNGFIDNYAPSVATIRFDVKTLGGVACKTLIDAINGKNVPSRTLLGYDIIFRSMKK